MENSQIEIIKKFISSTKGCVNVLELSDSSCLKDIEKDYTVIDVASDFSPYKPFLKILKSFNPSEKLIEEKAYSVQKETFSSYFRDGIAAERFDIPLNGETVYEQNRFKYSIISMLEECCTGNYLILNCQCLSPESVSFIPELEKSNTKGKFVFCFCALKDDITPAEVFKFIDEYSTHKNFLSIKMPVVSIAKDKTEYKSILDMSCDEQFDVSYRTLRNCRIFMDKSQLREFALCFSDNLFQFEFVEDQKREISLELAKGLFECNLFDEAILYLNDIIDTQLDDELNSVAYYCLARAFFVKKSQVLAEKYHSLAVKEFKKTDNKKYLALCAMLDFQFAKRDDSEYTIAKYNNCLEQLENQGFINNYINVSVSVPWKLMNDLKARKAIDDGIEKCLGLAKKIDNQHLVSTAAHWKGIICSHYGEEDEALKWYDKCNAIRTKIGEIVPLMNIRNGLCYDSTGRALYKRAYDLVNGVIHNLCDIRDYSAVIDTLKNITYALVYSRHFTQAYELCNVISHFLNIFNIKELQNNSFLPSINDMLVFKSIINFDSQDFIHARVNHANIMQNPNSVTKEERPLIYFIEAVLNADEKDVVCSMALFRKCIDDFRLIKSRMAHKIVFCYYEYAVNLSRLGFEKESKMIMQEGFEIARAEKFEYFTKGKKSALTIQEYLDGVEKFEPLDIDLRYLNEKAEKEKLLSQLHKRIHDYQFINKIKTNSIKDMNIKKYMTQMLSDICEYTFAAEACFGALDDNGCYKTFEVYGNEKQLDVTPEVWEKLFASSKKSEILQLVWNDDIGCFFGNCTYAKFKFGIIICPSCSEPFNADVLNTINIALTSIQSQVVIFKQEENLMIMSSTDNLSRLKNRHAFQECIALESERVRRYQQRKETVIQMAVAFIDLDNFKYYNDNFGHNVGDLLIKNFAELLRQTCRKIDFISRYGGDEFVVILIDTNAAEGIRVYSRLRERLEQAEYFIPEIKALLKDDTIQIPENRRIGFSMGISTNYDVEQCDNLEKVVQKADKALYYSKEHCKGSVTVWEDIAGIMEE